MGLYENDDYTSPVTDTFQITVPDPIHVALKMDTNNERMKLQMKSCWATPK